MGYHNRNNAQAVAIWLKRMGMAPVESTQTRDEAIKAATEKAERYRVDANVANRELEHRLKIYDKFRE